jgi:hypothetical protein
VLIRGNNNGLSRPCHLGGRCHQGCGQSGGRAAWPQPRSVRAVHGFLGLTGYYRKFIWYYGDIAAPLTQLLKRESFRWSLEAAAAFDAWKNAPTSAPALQLPNFDKTFIIDCDASGLGFGAVLHHGARPMSFFNGAIAPHHAKLATEERELIVLVKVMRHWWPYLWMRSFILQTNHFSLKYLLDQHLSMIPQHAWVSKLSIYQFSIKLKPGRQNSVADALSRHHKDDVVVHAMYDP